MRIIVLQGKSSTGKTRTLNLVYNLFLQNGSISMDRKILGNPDQNDFSDIIIRDTEHIAFYTMGDYSTGLSNAIYNYNHLSCHVLICALSTNNPNVRANSALSKFNVTRINKTNELNTSNQFVSNYNDAQLIINLI